jgi:hypothetical protein
MPKPGCSTCRIEMGMYRCGVTVLEKDGERDYRLWQADEWECSQCGARVITGYAAQPIEHFDLRFAPALEAATRAGTLRILYEHWQDVPENQSTEPWR